MREHPVALVECLRRARVGALFPPAMMDPDGNGLRKLTAKEWDVERLKIVGRAEDYARWRVQAFEEGECAYPY